MKKLKLFIPLITLLISTVSISQIGRTYSDGHGGRVFFPFGDISFADEVISYSEGSPAPIDGYGPQSSLGIPDYIGEYEKKFTTLGYGGEMVVKFTDNILYDIEGPDLFILEVGPAIEPVEVEISKNGKNWIAVGKTGGGVSSIDIADYVKKSDIFRYVKVIDIEEKTNGRWPGADIDAIGAIGSSLNFQLSSEVLFDFGKAELDKDKSKLYEVAGKIKEIDGLTVIEGYTDNVGSEESNIELSEKRAKAIKSFFIDSCNLSPQKIKTYALGESNPVADNNTEEGRQQNRRVEIIVFPDGETPENEIEGIYETEKRGKLYIYTYGDTIAGWYESDGGEILGTITDDHTIEGKWIENDSGEACGSYVYDRNHWGSLIIKFNEDFTSFDAKWAYCDKEPTNGGWKGKKK